MLYRTLKHCIIQLEKLGFDFRLNHQLKLYHDNQWNKRLVELIKYKASHDGADPPSTLKGVGPWSFEQRRLWKEGLLSKDRTNKLKEAGFALDHEFKHSKESGWVQRYGRAKCPGVTCVCA